MGGKRSANMGKRGATYKNTFSAQRYCKLETITGQGKMVLVREKSGKSQGILISHLCGNPDILFNRFVIISLYQTEYIILILKTRIK